MVSNTVLSVVSAVYFLCAVVSALPKSDIILQKSITKHGYPVELHKANTTDGYILTIARIPSPGSPVVLLLHGLLSSSVDWTVQGTDKSLAFIAADAGYDVWLGNTRGNTFSKTHETLSNHEPAYWRFSFHEMGLHDLPAMVDYILAHDSVDKPTLHYIAHSQGGAAFLVLAGMRPEYNAKFDSVHLMAPAAFIGRGTSPLLQLSYRSDELQTMARLTKTFEIAGRGTMGSTVDLFSTGHKAGIIPTDLVLMNIGYIVGTSDSINRSMVNDILANTPAGCSLNQLVHFGQIFRAKSFQLYDYGSASNMQRYGAKVPPEYPLRNVTAPVNLYYGDGDNLVPAEDIEDLADQLPNVVQKLKIAMRKWNHIDFLYHYNAHRLYRMVVASLGNQSVVLNT